MVCSSVSVKLVIIHQMRNNDTVDLCIELHRLFSFFSGGDIVLEPTLSIEEKMNQLKNEKRILIIRVSNLQLPEALPG